MLLLYKVLSLDLRGDVTICHGSVEEAVWSMLGGYESIYSPLLNITQMTFWSMNLYSDTLHKTDITSSHGLVYRTCSFKATDVQMGDFFYVW